MLKRQKKGWGEEFESEKAVYQRLAPLQGTVIPSYYGEAECPATNYTAGRALVFSSVGGIGLYEDAAGGLDTEHVESMLLDSLHSLASLGVAHDDSKLDNYRLVGDRIMVIDFDSSYILEDGDPGRVPCQERCKVCHGAVLVSPWREKVKTIIANALLARIVKLKIHKGT